MTTPLTIFARRILAQPPGTAALLKNPLLIWEAPQGSSDEAHWMLTQAGGPPPPRPTAGEPLVLEVVKQPHSKNPFAMGVTIGRVESNDIIIDDNSVSRFHAWFQFDEKTHVWTLTDAESKNGTWVDGRKVEARQHVPMADGTLIKLGQARFRFLLPDSALAFIRQRVQFP